MKVRLKGLHYVTRAGKEFPPYALVELPIDEAHKLVTQGVADYEGLPVVETAVAAAPVEIREEVPFVASDPFDDDLPVGE